MLKNIFDIFGLHAKPNALLRLILGALPFVLLVGAYLHISKERRLENPDDKITPPISQMVDSFKELAFEEDKRTGEYVLWSDTLSSLKRIGIGILVASLVGLLLGLNMGVFAFAESKLLPFVTFVSIVPPLSILPILFIFLGVDELAKISLIFLGTMPMITRDIYLAVQKIPKEQITKSLTLGASQLQVVYKIIMPQIMPRLLDTVRLSMGAAWLFLIAAEAIASTDGLGYRIFLVRRYLAMDIIIPYVLWITALGFSFDWLLRHIVKWRYTWYQGES